jgi:hypothetical protein
VPLDRLDGTPSKAVAAGQRQRLHATKTAQIATALGLLLAFTPVRSPESNGVSEAFVKKRDYARVTLLPDAEPCCGFCPAGLKTTTPFTRMTDAEWALLEPLMPELEPAWCGHENRLRFAAASTVIASKAASSVGWVWGGDLGDSGAVHPVEHRRQRQKAPALARVLRCRGKPPKLTGREIRSHAHCCWHGANPPRAMESAQRSTRIPP